MRESNGVFEVVFGIRVLRNWGDRYGNYIDGITIRELSIKERLAILFGRQVPDTLGE